MSVFALDATSRSTARLSPKAQRWRTRYDLATGTGPRLAFVSQEPRTSRAPRNAHRVVVCECTAPGEALAWAGSIEAALASR